MGKRSNLFWQKSIDKDANVLKNDYLEGMSIMEWWDLKQVKH